MSNVTLDNITNFPEFEDGQPSEVENIFWITGLILSSLCLILQLVLFIIRPNIRKIDQKILSQLTLARLMNSVLEYMITYALFNDYTKDLTFALYQQTDVVLICWMFLYTKNLYEKVVLVFALQKWNFTVLSLLIWILTIPLGVLCPVSIIVNHFDEFYLAYSCLKFVVLTLNILFFGRIFYVIITRNNHSNRNFADIIKTCVISFILVTLTSLQVFLNDILSNLEVVDATNIYCVINSYQAIAATIIFMILAKNSL